MQNCNRFALKILLHFQAASETKKSVFSVFGNNGILCLKRLRHHVAKSPIVISKKLLLSFSPHTV
jgi:hypothetical protein